MKMLHQAKRMQEYTSILNKLYPEKNRFCIENAKNILSNIYLMSITNKKCDISTYFFGDISISFYGKDQKILTILIDDSSFIGILKRYEYFSLKEAHAIFSAGIHDPDFIEIKKSFKWLNTAEPK